VQDALKQHQDLRIDAGPTPSASSSSRNLLTTSGVSSRSGIEPSRGSTCASQIEA
jgi:hypothetical protein